ncbi:hypothetical protein [Microbacterium jejuense]|uniref:acyltransferase n=1 Tax=Microbacterium jejuense TaxID=1263637 RepID=UPI0031E5A5E2
MAGNTLIVVRADGTRFPVEQMEGLTVDFRGEGSTIEIGEGSVFRNSKIIMGLEGLVSIGRTHRRGLNNTVVDMSGNGTGKLLSIGAGTSIEGCRFAMAGGGPREVRLGEHCLLSSNITFRPSDGHAIFDLTTGEVLNHAKPIHVGDHVWIGAGVTFVKGSRVAGNNVVGTQSLVSRRFDEQFTAIAGNPARVVKTSIGWDRAHVEDYDAALSKA